MGLEITGVMYMIWGGVVFCIFKMSSMNIYCFGDLKKHSFPKSLATNDILKLHAYCHSLYLGLGLGDKQLPSIQTLGQTGDHFAFQHDVVGRRVSTTY